MGVLLKKENVKCFENVYQDMIKQFPESELKSFETYMDLLNSDNYQLFIAYDGTTKVGYSLMAVDNINNVVWLDYLAIHKEFHSKGYGRMILEALKDCFANFEGCFLEVEKPDNDCVDTIRRIKFYENLGAVKLLCDYYYPNNSGYLPMDMYFIPYNSKIPNCEVAQNSIKYIFGFLHSDIKHINQVLKKITFID